MRAEHWNGDEWMTAVECPSPEWDRRMADAKRLQDWLYKRITKDAKPVPVSQVSAAMTWTDTRTLEAAQAHYWIFVVDGEDGNLCLDIDGE